MVKIVLVLLVFNVLCVFHIVQALPTPDEERYMDKEYNRELLNWLNGAQNVPQQYSNLCKYPYYMGNAINAPMPKRNSELINSLLSLPKNMNDAGK